MGKDFTGSPPANGIIVKRAPDSSKEDKHATYLPSGDTCAHEEVCSVSGFASAPSIVMRQSKVFPSRGDVKTTQRPSGERVGDKLLSPSVNCFKSEPSMFTRQISLLPERFD